MEATGFCLCSVAGWLDVVMIAALCLFILSGYPVAFTLAGIALLFAALGVASGVFDISFIRPLPQRIFGAMTNSTLIAIPMFILMGMILEKAKIAEELLEDMARLFGTLPGGLGISVMVVGALLAASTGIVGATVVTMGLLSLPTMLKRGYDPSFAAGSIAAAGTLGQIIPPSIVLILLGDVISNAYQKAQLESGALAPKAISVGDLFAGALIPGLCLVALYILYQILVAAFQRGKAPAIAREDGMTLGDAWRRALRSLPAPLALIISVLGSILAGVATPTEAASVGAVGALLISGARSTTRIGGVQISILALASAAAIALLIAMSMGLDLRIGRDEETSVERFGTLVAALLAAIAPIGIAASAYDLTRSKVLTPILDQTVRITAMVFTILIGAALFSLVFRGLGGDETIHALLEQLPGGRIGALIVVMAVMFFLGFILDFIEITLVVVPLVVPALLKMGFDPVWLGVMMAVNLQTSFLTPPFGFALFYLRGVAPPEVTTGHIYAGVIPFIVLQIAMLGMLFAFPGIATWLPEQLAK
jgi:tripartite ATP-independent transporter DctM subunit